jgi:hypothetical protein
MNKLISILCLMSLIATGCKPSKTQVAQIVAHEVGRKIVPGVEHIVETTVQREARKKAEQPVDDFAAKLVPHPNSYDPNLQVKLKINQWKSNCENGAKNQLRSFLGRATISQEQLNELTEQAVDNTIQTCRQGPPTLENRIKSLLASELVSQILNEAHEFQLVSDNPSSLPGQ